MDDFYAIAIPDASQRLRCVACGREFAQSNAYSNHVSSCRSKKKRMASALDQAKETYRKKKARFNTTLGQPQELESQELRADAATPARAEVGSLRLQLA